MAALHKLEPLVKDIIDKCQTLKEIKDQHKGLLDTISNKDAEHEQASDDYKDHESMLHRMTRRMKNLGNNQQKEHDRMALGLRIFSLHNDNEERVTKVELLVKELVALRKKGDNMTAKIEAMTAEIEAKRAAWQEKAEAAKDGGDDSGLSWGQGDLVSIAYCEAMKTEN